MIQFFRVLITTTALACLLTGCSKPRGENEVIVGTMAGPETELMETAKEVAANEYNLNIKIIEFNDYSLPNPALADGSIDANLFQHQPYLDAAIKARGYRFAVLGKMFIYPMGVYSSKYKNIKDIPNGATIAIPNDPSNESRALLLLKKAGLIKLSADGWSTATVNDITENTKQLKFQELDAAQLPRALEDVDAAVINTNFAMLAGLLPSKDALVLESSNSPYVNIVVVRESDTDKPKIINLIRALHSKPVIDKAQEIFKGQAIIGW